MDSCQNCESPSTQTTSIVNKWGDLHEYKFCGDGCEGQYMRENKMSYEAQGIARAEWNDDRFTDDIICSVCSEPYDGTEVLDDYNAVIIHKRCAMKDSYEAEDQEDDGCCFCGADYGRYGNNAQPLFDGRCCNDCNAEIVIPARISQMFGAESDHPAELIDKLQRMGLKFTGMTIIFTGIAALGGYLVGRNRG